LSPSIVDGLISIIAEIEDCPSFGHLELFKFLHALIGSVQIAAVY